MLLLCLSYREFSSQEQMLQVVTPFDKDFVYYFRHYFDSFQAAVVLSTGMRTRCPLLWTTL